LENILLEMKKGSDRKYFYLDGDYEYYVEQNEFHHKSATNDLKKLVESFFEMTDSRRE